MTENEALKELRLQSIVLKRRVQANREIEEFVSSALLEQRKNAIDIAIQALSEIQQYRELGTVKEIKIREAQFARLSEGYLNDLTLLREYQAIGTVEELQELKEKNTPQELAEHNFQDEVHHYLCPNCRCIVSYTQNYCEWCGQALET